MGSEDGYKKQVQFAALAFAALSAFATASLAIAALVETKAALAVVVVALATVAVFATAAAAVALAHAQVVPQLPLIHIRPCRRSTLCNSRWSPDHSVNQTA